jgi:hypothetical protein
MSPKAPDYARKARIPTIAERGTTRHVRPCAPRYASQRAPQCGAAGVVGKFCCIAVVHDASAWHGQETWSATRTGAQPSLWARHKPRRSRQIRFFDGSVEGTPTMRGATLRAFGGLLLFCVACGDDGEPSPAGCNKDTDCRFDRICVAGTCVAHDPGTPDDETGSAGNSDSNEDGGNMGGDGQCTPDCGFAECGPDGCGGYCGQCDADQECRFGECCGEVGVAPCQFDDSCCSGACRDGVCCWDVTSVACDFDSDCCGSMVCREIGGCQWP